LDQADGILTGNWPDVTVRYWRFGKGDPQLIPNIRNFYVQRIDPNAKHDPMWDFSEKETHIDAAIESNVPSKGLRDELKIIVTDLFQTQNDLGKLATELNTGYLKQPDTAISVLCIRNSFFGKIYDLPNENDILPEGAADSLPFYILICGKLPDVQHATELLKKRLKLSTESILSIIYSSHPIPESTQPLRIKESGDYTVYTNLVKGAEEERIPQVAISKGKLVEIPLTEEFPGETVRSVVNTAFKLQKSLNVTAQKWGKSDYENFKPDDPDKPAFQVDSSQRKIIVDGSQLEKRTVYLVSMDLQAAPGDLSEVNSWGLRRGDFKSIMDQKKFDETKEGHRPGKTPNLDYFLQTLTDRVFQNPVPLARYYLYVKVI
jgi:hypothetical protein